MLGQSHSRMPVIVDGIRTPIGKYGGSLRDIRPDDLGAVVIRKLLARNRVDPAHIDDVIMGCANQAGEDNRNVARMSSLLAGLPVTVPGVTVNRLCGSGLEAVNQAAHAILAGQGELFIAGGVESMTRAPFVMMKAGTAFERGSRELHDTTLGWRLVNDKLAAEYPPISMGETAENVAELYGIDREAQDRYALRSQRNCAEAAAAGKWASELVPVELPSRDGRVPLFEHDEHARPNASLEQLAKLPPAFRAGGTVTAGNSAGINDGAAAVLMASHAAALRLGLTPRLRFVSSAVAGVDPSLMGTGPIPAARKALTRAGLTVRDLDLVEINEAFAAQVLAVMSELQLDPDKVNVNGGAIALGHPLGASGARIAVTLLHELERRQGKYGMLCMCIGVGQGIATIVERL